MYQPTLNEHFPTKSVSKSIKLLTPFPLIPNRFQIRAETNPPMMKNISQSVPKRDHYQLMAKYCSRSSIGPKEPIILHCTSKREKAKISSNYGCKTFIWFSSNSSQFLLQPICFSDWKCLIQTICQRNKIRFWQNNRWQYEEIIILLLYIYLEPTKRHL